MNQKITNATIGEEFRRYFIFPHKDRFYGKARRKDMENVLMFFQEKYASKEKADIEYILGEKIDEGNAKKQGALEVAIGFNQHLSESKARMKEIL